MTTTCDPLRPTCLACVIPAAEAYWPTDASQNIHEIEAYSFDPIALVCPADAAHGGWEIAPIEWVAMDSTVPPCPECRASGAKLDSVASRPELAALWDEALNGKMASQVGLKSSTPYRWHCAIDRSHRGHTQTVSSRAENPSANHCPDCYGNGLKWTDARVLAFVRDIRDLIDTLTPPQLFAICQQAGLVASPKTADLVENIINGNMGELERMLADGADESGHAYSDASADDEGATAEGAGNERANEAPLGDLDPKGARVVEATLGAANFPTIDNNALLSVAGRLMARCDKEAADYLAASTVARLWVQAYELDRLNRDAPTSGERLALENALSITKDPVDNEFAETVRQRFRTEYEASLGLVAPEGWSFKPAGTDAVVQPNLMQRHVAIMLRERLRYGNWSGTGAGKTVSAVLGARILGAGEGAGVVLVVCPKGVIAGWREAVLSCYPDSRVEVGTLAPSWVSDQGGPRWLIVNYDKLAGAEGSLRALVDRHGVDMLIVRRSSLREAPRGAR